MTQYPCIVFYWIGLDELDCIVLHRFALYCIVLYFIVLSRFVSYGIVWYCIVLDWIGLYRTVPYRPISVNSQSGGQNNKIVLHLKGLFLSREKKTIVCPPDWELLKWVYCIMYLIN